jgi:hypothetical protein
MTEGPSSVTCTRSTYHEGAAAVSWFRLRTTPLPGACICVQHGTAMLTPRSSSVNVRCTSDPPGRGTKRSGSPNS